MKSRQIVVVGMSAGGIEALQKLVAQIPAEFAGTIFIATHLAPDHTSRLPQILQPVSRLSAVRAGNRE
jgi:two-component system chemotaxis response regulator CheB